MKSTFLRSAISYAFSFAFLATSSAYVSAQSTAAATAKGKTELLWFGQDGFRIKSPEGKMTLIDPWITGGPKTPPQYKNDLTTIGPIDLLLVTHAHADHIGDAPTVAKSNNIKLYGPADMVTPLTTLGILPADLGWRFNKTGRVNPLPWYQGYCCSSRALLIVSMEKPCDRKNGSSSCR
ncbi:MBL fold metallo-hydrolase [Polynucleobacter necessarius]|uniref:MBL fold metallo-hydrolase n=1 Tax=Polynucleobacter necessarius TaxID=576610 RepID=UPI0022B26563|nr:MBL fold metallo-hydrolase [Polynucleobacter necessarius]